VSNVLLTHGYFVQEDEKERKIMRPYPPLGLLYVAAWLEKHGIANAVFDTTFSSMQSLQQHLLTARPDYCCIYVNLMTKVNVVQIMQLMQQHLPAATIILGGPEVRNHAENFLEYGAHFIVLGEGEVTTLELLQHLQQGKEPVQVAGLVYKAPDGTIHRTGEREKIKDLNNLPLPARDKIDLQAYLDAWKQAHGMNAISVNTMRGCPYTCKWCSRAVYGLSYRRRSPEHVVAELKYLKTNYQPDTLWFVDDVFTVSHKWLAAFAEEVRRQDAVIPYECITRADRMSEEVIDLLKASGCFRVWIGAESGSQRVIDLMDRRVDVRKVREMIQLSREKGLEAGTFIMLGYPGETEADIEATVEHLKVSHPDYYTITIAYPIKGTEMYAEVEERFVSSLDWATSTDRDVDYERTYARKYYDYAVRYVVNEVAAARTSGWAFVKHKLKSAVARGGMHWERRWN
jgi:anaerobic magnesium-protoporphyrin IX monomethyl ester cyclase